MSTALAEQETSTDLIPVSADDEAKIAELTRLGDTEALSEGRVRANAAQLYAKRKGYVEQANVYGRLTVLAEAGIGLIDIKQYPSPSSRYPLPPLKLGGALISSSTRDNWRVLGFAHLQNLLEPAFSAIADGGGMIYSCAVRDYVRSQGAGWVDPKPLANALRVWKKSGRSARELANEAAVNETTVSHVLTKGHQPALRYFHAIALADVLGVNRGLLRPARSALTGPRRIVVKRTIPAPGLCSNADWSKAYSGWRKALDAISRVTGEGNDDLWQHLNAASDIIIKEARK